MECTYNKRANTYNLHFHILVDTKNAAEFFRKQWLEKRTTARAGGQDVSRANKGSLKEVFKYITKIAYKSNTSRERFVDAYSLDVIFNAFKGRKTIQPFGFQLKKDPDEIEDEDVVEDEEVVAVFKWVNEDWVDVDTGEMLTDNVISDVMREVFENVNIHPPDV